MTKDLQSENIADIVKAMVEASRGISHALKDKNNPHFNNDFASLEAVIDATKSHYLNNGLVVLQHPMVDGAEKVLVTTIAHISGQWFKSYTPILSKDPNDPQKMGSGLTYARRYALAAMANISQTDDDGADASSSGDGDDNGEKPKGASKPSGSKPAPAKAGKAPLHCGTEMRKSQYAAEWYCPKCKSKLPLGDA